MTFLQEYFYHPSCNLVNLFVFKIEHREKKSFTTINYFDTLFSLEDISTDIIISDQLETIYSTKCYGHDIINAKK